MTNHDRDRLVGVHPLLVFKMGKVLDLMARAGRPMFVLEGLRSQQRQQMLFAQSRTAKGPRVTNCDGVKIRGNHQVSGDGYGHAVDCAFIGPEPFAPEHPWALYGQLLQDEGLKWGGTFISLPADLTHAELTIPLIAGWKPPQRA